MFGVDHKHMTQLYSFPHLSAGYVLQNPWWMTETTNTIKPYIYYAFSCFFLYEQKIRVYSKDMLDRGVIHVQGEMELRAQAS